ncbi:MAG TPA: ATP-binding protein [Opitutus sp.]|nr:ATP-binding protein [Opitutus sp.]
MKFRDIPIRRKLTVVILLTSAAMLAFTCAAFFAYEFLTFRRATVQNLSTIGEIVAANSTAALAFDNPDDAREILGALQAQKHIVAAAIYNAQGGLFTKYPATLADSALPARPGPDGYQIGLEGLTSFQPVTHNDRRLGTLFLRSDMSEMRERFQLYGLIVLLVIVGSLLVAFVFSNLLQKRISQPILELAETARAISERRDFSVRAVKHGGDEIGRLTDAFNDMLGQIGEQNGALRESEARLQALNQQLEQRVQERTAQLEGANKELEAFSYSVSHDLRAPLRHIDGFASMLTAHAKGTLDEKARRYINVISESARRMGRLIDDLLSFSRHGRMPLKKIPVRLGNIVQEVLQQLQSETAGRTIEWRIATLPEVTGDVAMLHQVFANLLGNAVKYSRNRADATIEVGTLPGKDGEAVVFVRDNGAGFNPKYADRLFGVFQRLHSESEFEGTGVGLANVQRIIRRHGGRVWAEGEEGRGATFYFSLPCNPAETEGGTENT